jgi:nitrogen fixation protein NifQ
MAPESAHPVAGPAGAALADPAVVAAVARFSADDLASGRFAEQVRERRVEYDAIVEMLLQHATPGVDQREAEVVARSIAAGSLGEQHLWRDLELPNRAVLRKLFDAYFEPFSADNIMDMRWKKFIYRRLCRWGGFNTCTAPSCGVCSSRNECFEDETS